MLSISDAIDLARPSIASHQLRTAYIAWRIAETAGFGLSRIKRVFVAALFHDIGAIPDDQGPLQLEFDSPLGDAHSSLGAEILARHSHFVEYAPLVRWHHRPWYQWEKINPGELEMESQALYLADLIERLTDRDAYILAQIDGIRTRLFPLVGSGIGPDVYAWFESLAAKEEFWLSLSDARLYSTLLREGPLAEGTVDLDTVEEVSELSRDIIDLKSPFTSAHTTGVARCAELIARSSGIDEDEARTLRITANLHDIGKLAVPNSLLDKPGPLTKHEFAVMKSHAFYTYRTLNSIGGMAEIARVAASHHEKMDGSGYPFHFGEAEIHPNAKLLAVSDILTALVEDRPYRAGMSEEAASGVLLELAEKGQLDLDAARAATQVVGELKHIVRTLAKTPAKTAL